jgi:hypothetical protein
MFDPIFAKQNTFCFLWSLPSFVCSLHIKATSAVAKSLVAIVVAAL